MWRHRRTVHVSLAAKARHGGRAPRQTRPRVRWRRIAVDARRLVRVAACARAGATTPVGTAWHRPPLPFPEVTTGGAATTGVNH